MFGGAFDPPHVAHVTLARAAVEQLKLDQLRIFPTGKAW
ncbi:MAG: nicotinate-nicotinamide nucleotide adenylyltransferase, partial [Pseudomonadota bacterium]